MFKKNLIYLSLISFALLSLGALALKFMPNRDSGNAETPRPQPIELKALNPQPYQITTQTYRKRNTKITFPQLRNYRDRAKQAILNLLIKNDALRVRRYYTHTKQGYNLDISYQIKFQSAKLLSVQYSGVGYAPGAAYPNNWFYTTNLDLKTGRRLRLRDLVKIDAKLVAQIKNRSKALNPEHQKILTDLSTAELLQKLRAADPPNWNGGEATFSYLTEDALGISLSVIHTLGDHAEFEMYQAHPTRQRTPCGVSSRITPFCFNSSRI
jgi:hypothetical protein